MQQKQEVGLEGFEKNEFGFLQDGLIDMYTFLSADEQMAAVGYCYLYITVIQIFEIKTIMITFMHFGVFSL